MGRCVLVVEDNPLNLQLAQVVLEVHGFEVLEAHDAEECFAVLQERRPDLVLMDVKLPGKDGLEITRELRATPETRDLAVVALTAHGSAQYEQRVLEAGCDGYLTKPFNTRTLASQLEGFLPQDETPASSSAR
jgi:CheY-like chemotaxis protein